MISIVGYQGLEGQRPEEAIAEEGDLACKYESWDAEDVTKLEALKCKAQDPGKDRVRRLLAAFNPTSEHCVSFIGPPFR